MIIVTGKIYVQPGTCKEFLERSADAMAQARKLAECLDFVVAADPLEPDRVNVLEMWMDYSSLANFRGNGPESGLSDLIIRAVVEEYEVTPAA